MFSKIVVFSGLLALVLAGPLQQQQARILAQEQEVLPDGSFRWSYQSEDGSAQQAVGEQREIGGPEPAQTVSGSAQWIDPLGDSHQLTYTADENGYRPESADLPVAPPVPEAILRALKWIVANLKPEYQQ